MYMRGHSLGSLPYSSNPILMVKIGWKVCNTVTHSGNQFRLIYSPHRRLSSRSFWDLYNLFANPEFSQPGHCPPFFFFTSI